MDPELIKQFSQLGAVGILALVMYYQNNKNAMEYARRTDELAKQFGDRIEALLNVERGRTEMLVRLVTDNTAQTATNTAVVQALHRRLDDNHAKENPHGSA